MDDVDDDDDEDKCVSAVLEGSETLFVFVVVAVVDEEDEKEEAEASERKECLDEEGGDEDGEMEGETPADEVPLFTLITEFEPMRVGDVKRKSFCNDCIIGFKYISV